MEILRTVHEALLLRADVLERLPGLRWWVLVGIAVLAGGSTLIGHLAILFLNRIRGLRLVATIGLNAAVLTVLHVVQALVIWAVATLVRWEWAPIAGLVQAALLALAPMVLNFLTAIPHFGLAIGKGIELWTAVILWLGVTHVLGFTWWMGLAVTGVGWLVMQLLSRLLEQPMEQLMTKVFSIVSGAPTLVTGRDVLAGTPLIPVPTSERP